ncbi:MAG: hypothetical protein ABL921_32980, partial [Pirellula sp.]
MMLPPRSAADSQFSLQTMFWLMIALALLLVYANSLGREEVGHAVFYMAVSLSAGRVIGLITQRWNDSLFWSLMMTLLAYLAVAGGRLPTVAIVYGWGIIGAVSGA